MTRRILTTLEEDLSGQDLTNRDFSNHDVTKSKFSKSDLRGVLFFDSNLRNVDLSTAKNLNTVQFGGANLGGAPFPGDYKFPGLEHAGNVTQNAKTVFFLMLLANVIAWLTVANVSDGALIANASGSSLPIIEFEVPIVRFFLFAPLLLLLVHAYFVVHLQRVWEEVTLLPAIFPDGHSVVRHLPSWLPVGIVRIYYHRLRGRKPPLIYLQICAAVIAVWLVQPFTMVLFGARYLITRDSTGLLLLVTLFFLTAMLSACSFVLTKRTLRGDFRYTVRNSTSAESTGAGSQRSIVFKIYGQGLIIALIPTLVFVTGARDYQKGYGYTRNLEDWRIMQLIGFRYTAVIRDTNLSDSQLDLSQRDLFNARFLDSEFSNGDFSGADLSNAYVLRSRFDDVRFDGTILNDVYVNGASFRNTSFDLRKCTTKKERPGDDSKHGFSGELMNSCANHTYWTGKIGKAVFFNNSFKAAVFHNVNMDKVFFTSSDLRGASFRNTSFDTVYFTGSKLQGSLFEWDRGGNTNKKQKDIDRKVENENEKSRKRHAVTIYGSNLEDAYFRNVIAPVVIIQSNLRNAVFEGDISGLVFVHSDLRGADFSKVENINPASFRVVCLGGARFPQGTNFTVAPCQNWQFSSLETATQTDTPDVCNLDWAKQNVVGDLKHGSIVAKGECDSCHNTGIGPVFPQDKNIWISGIDPLFTERYSNSLRAIAIPWDSDTLDLYLRSPDRLVPGNRMRILGIRDPGVRKNVVMELFPDEANSNRPDVRDDEENTCGET